MNKTSDSNPSRRFGGIERLLGAGSLKTLRHARVAVIGVGGVGSWAVEGLARSGIGHITLIDFDHVALSNVNRQIQALNSTLGMAKVQALKQRIHDINPDCEVDAIEEFLSAENMPLLMPPNRFDAVIDACDDARVKAALVTHARQSHIWVVVCGATGGKRNSLKLYHADLGRTAHDGLLLRVRKLLRSVSHILPRKNGKYGVDALYVDEPAHKNPACDAHDLNCSGFGSSVAVTASMGLAAAQLCVGRIAAQIGAPSAPPDSGA